MPISLADAPVAGPLRVEDLSAGYGGVPIIHHVSVSVDRGAIATIVGPNGAGKSTLLKAITGMVPCQGGAVKIDGSDVTGLRADEIARRGVGYVPQVRDVFTPLTVKENLEMGGYPIARKVREERIREVFAAFPALSGLRDRRAGNLSGGERKMLAIGRVLMTQPKLLVLDEPTANLSPRLAHEFLDGHVRRLAAQGVTILLVEQRALDALAVATWAYVMVAGKVTLSAPASSILERGDIGEMFLGKHAVRAPQE
jgi:ABC-type branched-subunit amino acid transport system ATPase component